jgi:hypothetical protein
MSDYNERNWNYKTRYVFWTDSRKTVETRFDEGNVRNYWTAIFRHASSVRVRDRAGACWCTVGAVLHVNTDSGKGEYIGELRADHEVHETGLLNIVSQRTDWLIIWKLFDFVEAGMLRKEWGIERSALDLQFRRPN